MSARPLFTDPDSIFTEANDFAVSVSSRTSLIPLFLLILWISGMAVVSFFTLRSFSRRRILEKSALPVQNPQVQDLYKKCCSELKIKKAVPVYSTAFLASPYAAGLLKPRIYLPIQLISDFSPAELRFILLHELQHCRQKDTFISFLMPLTGILYWFNPLVWYALRKIQCDREIACDSAVLQLLKPSDHHAYGNTLIDYAEKISHFPYTAGISGSKSQMESRILNIIHFQRDTKISRLRGGAVLTILACLFVFSAPALAFPGSPQYGEAYFPEHMDHISVVETMTEVLYYMIPVKTHGQFIIPIMPPKGSRQIPPTKYMTHCLGWNPVSLLPAAPVWSGMAKISRSIHGKQTRH